MIEQLIEEVKKAHQGAFFTLAITGSVSAGKSTLAEMIAVPLEGAGLKTAIVSTDDFLKSNDRLHQEGIFEQKGFPVSYDLEKLSSFIENYQNGMEQQTLAEYSQNMADIIPEKTKTVEKPDVLILEGVVALQLDPTLLDLTVFLEADMKHVKDWYLQRNLMATVKSVDKPDSWRNQYVNLSLADFYKVAMDVWEKTNQKNYDDFILPSRKQADWVLSLDYYHQPQNLTVGPRRII
ncbi:type I pantothenate kinase [Fructobacillus sp. M2-14]|uniref:Type I pantothenate kinase n=1 Tax=Fructobacillus broussonetiae TaxID=2713173 RepID=A0ABS5QZS1_9LACO|nr:type I pantothenate kinase [Fructobacillus broussonetiae]MBS9338688.1 type I pantothenate kinase [Fructobacillus broussonetiae]